jgi:hypothetical protein
MLEEIDHCREGVKAQKRDVAGVKKHPGRRGHDERVCASV